MDEQQHRDARVALTAALIEALVALWQSLGSWHRPDVERFLRDALPLVRAHQRTLADVTAQRVAQRATDVLGVDVPVPVVPDEAAVDLRYDVDEAEVYERPFHDLWFALQEGDDLEAAVKKGADRLQGIAEMDMQQTHSESTRAAQKALPKRSRPRWWERTLEGEENCLLCVVASTRPYFVGDLNPLHPGCDCEIREHWTDPPNVVDEERLADAYGQAAEAGYEGTSAEHLRDIIAGHGEVGPTLIDPAARKREARAKKRAEQARTN